MGLKDLKQKVSIGRKMLVGEVLELQGIEKFQNTNYGEVVVFHAITEEGVEELVFSGGKAIVELMHNAESGDFPMIVRLVERLSANKRTYQEFEEVEE